ncbi:MAG: DUF4424 family protein, partial [Myxococcota bacterium]|nr:DUF4424 family protein [Myxococcota bacterium]
MGTERVRRNAGLTSLVGLSAIFIMTPALANDFAFGGEASQLQPLEETRVSMAAEDILMELKGDQWWVTANYRFKNGTDAPVKLKVGFPEFSCGEMEDYGDCDARFTEMKTWVEGAPVTMGTGEVAKDHPWKRGTGMGLPLGRVHTFELSFKAPEELEVRHTFRMTASGGVSFTEMNYITRTGNLWSGPIGEAKFTIRTADRPYSLEWPGSYTLVHGLERMKNGKRESEYLFQM